MASQPEPELPPLDDLDPLDQDRAADMVDNRPLYGAALPPALPPSPHERDH